MALINMSNQHPTIVLTGIAEEDQEVVVTLTAVPDVRRTQIAAEYDEVFGGHIPISTDGKVVNNVTRDPTDATSKIHHQEAFCTRAVPNISPSTSALALQQLEEDDSKTLMPVIIEERNYEDDQHQTAGTCGNKQLQSFLMDHLATATTSKEEEKKRKNRERGRENRKKQKTKMIMLEENFHSLGDRVKQQDATIRNQKTKITALEENAHSLADIVKQKDATIKEMEHTIDVQYIIIKDYSEICSKQEAKNDEQAALIQDTKAKNTEQDALLKELEAEKQELDAANRQLIAQIQELKAACSEEQDDTVGTK